MIARSCMASDASASARASASSVRRRVDPIDSLLAGEPPDELLHPVLETDS